MLTLLWGHFQPTLYHLNSDTLSSWGKTSRVFIKILVLFKYTDRKDSDNNDTSNSVVYWAPIEHWVSYQGFQIHCLLAFHELNCSFCQIHPRNTRSVKIRFMLWGDVVWCSRQWLLTACPWTIDFVWIDRAKLLLLFLKKLNQYHETQHLHSKIFTKEQWKYMFHKDLCLNVYSIIIHSSGIQAVP